MGYDDVKGMDVDDERVKLVLMVSACLYTAMVICLIPYVYLLAPHISRLFIGGMGNS